MREQACFLRFCGQRRRHRPRMVERIAVGGDEIRVDVARLNALEQRPPVTLHGLLADD